ncbi:sporulation YhaL family protein [Priestia koreensis]|uniref:sporulation YhaL family protein n=1 Tax=Priestia koreensis TaxID=284581 RepID=UPI001F5737CD|nr:sporulation YhaL family protein [Priestia koreensis]MCM3004747.1 sporulation YhaL family protein [Priestia koreensis]UNL85549.1 sporulation YhaL family protein [Priestia koreensis]
MFTLPFWIYLVVAGIFFSGFMAIKTAQQDREVEDEFIEKEGEVYMERLEQERERRKDVNQTSSI